MAGLQDIFNAPPSDDELQATGAPAAGDDDLFAPPTADEMSSVAKAQGFNDYEGRGFESSTTRGLARSALMLPALPAELINLGSDVVQYLGSQAASYLDPRVKPMKWSETSKTSDIPGLKYLGAESLYNNVIGPDALNIYPHRRPDETTIESAGGTLGEVLLPGVAGRVAVARSLTTPQRVQSANRFLAAETALGTAGTEIGGAIDKAQGGDGSQGRFIGGMAALAPSVTTMAGQTTKFLLRGGQQGADDINRAIGASDRMNDAAGNTYQPTRTQQIIDGVFGGNGRNLDLTAGQAAPRRGLVRTIERVASYMPGGYRVVADKIASQVENAARNVVTIANRQVQRFNARAAAENQSRVPSANYTMQQTGQAPRNALERPIPYIQGVSDDAAGAAVERGLNERVAVNDNVRRLAEADFQNRMPPTTQISMDNTIMALERLEARLPGSPSVSQGTLRSPVIGNMRNELINDAANGPNGSVTIPFGTIRALRTRVGEFLDGDANALGPSRLAEADARALYAALSEDMATAARNAGGDTWTSWQRAQAITRTGVEVAGEARDALNRQTLEGVEAGIASGEGSRVQAVMDALNDRERDLVVSNIFRKWGLAKAGAQDAAGEAWSFDSWLTNLNKAREKGSLGALTRSTDGQLNQAIADLTALADRVRQRSKFMPNPSGTGRVAIAAGTPIAVAFAAYSNPLLAAAVVATGYVAPNLISRLMVNPRFIRWLARSDEVSAASMPGHILRLGSMAQQPEMAEAVKAYTEALVNEFEKGDVLDKAAMVDPTPLSETARQIRDYTIGGKDPSASNLMASAGLIGMAAIGMGGARSALLKNAVPTGVNAKTGKLSTQAGLVEIRQSVPKTNEVYWIKEGEEAGLRPTLTKQEIEGHIERLGTWGAEYKALMENATSAGDAAGAAHFKKLASEAKSGRTALESALKKGEFKDGGDQPYVLGSTGGNLFARDSAPAKAPAKAAIEGSFDATKNEKFTFNGKEPHEFTPEDFEALGKATGVERLGPLTKPVAFKYENGGTFEIPGGVEGEFTYYDMLKMKADGINPSKIPGDLHAAIQKKMVRSMMGRELTDQQVWSGLAFGLTSPNNPLQPNQMAMSRLRMNSEADLKRLASMVPWEPGDDAARSAVVGTKVRSWKDEKTKKMKSETVNVTAAEQADRRIAASFGLNAGSEGGLGVRGTQDYTRAAELAKLFLKNPKWFQRRSGEEWADFAERVFTQVAGLKAKTGSFGVVFQDPVTASISAVDRHMAKIFEKEIFKSDADRLAWTERAINLHNTRNNLRGADKAKTMLDLPNGFIGEMLLAEVGKNSSPKYRLASGAKNTKGVPEALVREEFLVEPKSYELMGETYKRVLAANAAHAQEHGLGLFASQWQLWDRQRRRLEPHENMFPGLERIPRMSVEQLRRVNQAHTETGHRNYSKVKGEDGEDYLKPTKPMKNPSGLAYFGIGSVGVGLASQDDRERRR